MNRHRPLDDKLNTLQELIRLCYPLHFTRYSGNTMELLSTTSPNKDMLSALLAIDALSPFTGSTDPIQLLSLLDESSPGLPASAKNSSAPRFPMICTSSIGMVWISDVKDPAGPDPVIHVMGPVFVDEISVAKIENRLDHLHLSLTLKRHFISFIRELPVIQLPQLLQYAVMLHYCITGEKITVHRLFHSIPDDFSGKTVPAASSGRAGDYMLEQQLLSCVREGNLSYHSAFAQLSGYAHAEKKTDRADYLRYVKDLQIIFTSLCARAAIEGGLTPDSAYLISDHYLEKIEAADSIVLLGSIGQSMLEDFIKKVHRLKTHHVSPPVQKLCDYIQLHPEEKLDIHAFAEKLGYSDYYLTKKFKKEMGCSANEYLTRQKMEKAKQLLRKSQMPIGQIAEELHICSQSYFGNLFSRYTGMSPLEYRNRGDN